MNSIDHADKPHFSNHQHLFFISSPLHLIGAQVLVATTLKGQCCRLFFLKKELKEMIDAEGWESIDFLPWPRHFPVKGVFGRYRRTIRNAELVTSRATEANLITLYMPVIDSEAYNYNIAIARKITKGRQPDVCLIPDGLMNIRRHEQGRVRELSKIFRKLRRLITPSLNYYLFRGDRTGSDDPIVKRIYVFPDFPNEYSPEKTVDLDIVSSIKKSRRSDINIDKALVLSQPLTTTGELSDANLVKTSQAIDNYLRDTGIKDVDYKPHPRDKKNELLRDWYKELKTSTPLEYYLFKNPYKVIIGVHSTTLLLMKLLDSSCEVISFYPDLLKYKNENQLEENSKLFSQVGVEIKYFSEEV